MAEITTTQAFSDGDTVTATKLNNITGNASLQTEAITNRSAETTVDQANDLLLMYDASATALKKVTLSNVIKAGTASNFPVTGNATIGGTLGVTGVVSAASTIELGHASDTTLARGAAGRLTVEGVNVPTISSTDTLTNKTLTSPVISTISNTGTLTLPTSTDTLVGRATTDTLTNKTLTSPSLTSPSITSGVLTTQAGSVSAPAISPTGDTNTGLFFPAADTIAASTGGTEAMRIDSSGNVLLGQNRITSDSSITSLGIYGGLVSGSTTSQINFYGKSVSNTGLTYNIARITGIASDPNYSLAGGLQFSTASNDGVNNLTLTERLRIDSSGNLLIGKNSATANGGDLQISGGITFPASQSAKSNANTLDDYEEGTWTPNVGGNATYTSQTGIYTKIGNVVTCTFKISINTLGTGSATYLSGFPFTSANISEVQAGCVGYYASLANNTIFLAFYVENNATTAQFVGKSTSGASVDNGFVLFGNGTNVVGCVSYRTA